MNLRLLTERKHYGIIALVFLYVLANMVLTYREWYFLNLLPLVLLWVYLLLARIDLSYFVVVFFTPLSIQLIEFLPGSTMDMAIPTEPMLFGILILLLYRSFQQQEFSFSPFHHPVGYVILFNLFWIGITSLTSTMPLVSVKYFLARIWFIAIFFWLATMVFQKTIRNIYIFLWVYVLPMIGVIGYSIYRHWGFGWADKDASHFVMNPFFRDHTSYGAILAMLFFALWGITGTQIRGILKKMLIFLVWGIITLALVLSYTRAAWLSVFAGLIILVVVKLKFRLRYILFLGFVGLLLLVSQKTQLQHKLERNRQASSATLGEHVQSIANISTDDSNLERMNRWNCALRMFKERPLFGWGPGTFMFTYAPFQLSYQKTAISTNFGNLGNAHSEYFGPLSESGLLGLLSIVAVGVVTLITAFRVYNRLRNLRQKRFILGLILGYITYLVHGALNNFLDTDKASALFWGYTAVFVAMDIRLKKLDTQN
jgi:O-antigen ligase